MAGRKSLRDEVEIIKRYSDLSAPYFKFLRECLEGEDKADKKWAADNLKGAYAKMIPQDLTSGGEQITPAIINIVAPDGSNIQTVSKAVPGVAVSDGQDN